MELQEGGGGEEGWLVITSRKIIDNPICFFGGGGGKIDFSDISLFQICHPPKPNYFSTLFRLFLPPKESLDVIRLRSIENVVLLSRNSFRLIKFLITEKHHKSMCIHDGYGRRGAKSVVVNFLLIRKSRNMQK